MRRSELHDDLLNNILVFLQLAVNGKTDNIFLMVSLRVCATAANKHKIWIKSSSKKRWQRLKLQSCISAELYRQTIMHASCSYREFVKSSKVASSLARYSGFCMHLSSGSFDHAICQITQELCMHTVATPTNLPCIHIGVVLLL